MVLHRLIGQNSLKLFGQSTLGIRAIRFYVITGSKVPIANAW